MSKGQHNERYKERYKSPFLHVKYVLYGEEREATRAMLSFYIEMLRMDQQVYINLSVPLVATSGQSYAVNRLPWLRFLYK